MYICYSVNRPDIVNQVHGKAMTCMHTSICTADDNDSDLRQRRFWDSRHRARHETERHNITFCSWAAGGARNWDGVIACQSYATSNLIALHTYKQNKTVSSLYTYKQNKTALSALINKTRQSALSTLINKTSHSALSTLINKTSHSALSTIINKRSHSAISTPINKTRQSALSLHL